MIAARVLARDLQRGDVLPGGGVVISVSPGSGEGTYGLWMLLFESDTLPSGAGAVMIGADEPLNIVRAATADSSPRGEG